jgi:NAD(P)-dependent dehydrogenase (short-subunit alcohol dehydrogenase family)
MKTWFITGGTPGGFGLAYADAALAAGDQVALTTRRPAELQEWAAPYGSRVLVLSVDVTDPEQIHQAVATTERQFGGIDVLVNNAGRGWDGSVEGTDDEVVRRIFELNFFAVINVLREVLPGMRARRSGWIVTMSSVAGIRGVTGFGYYTAVKFAVEGVTDVLRDEVAPFGIRVLTVEPGSFRTNAYAGFADEPVRDIADYNPMLESVHAAMVKQNGKQPGDPNRGVAAVLAAMSEVEPPQRIVLGSAGFDSVVESFEKKLADVRSHEKESRSADYPSGS